MLFRSEKNYQRIERSILRKVLIKGKTLINDNAIANVKYKTYFAKAKTIKFLRSIYRFDILLKQKLKVSAKHIYEAYFAKQKREVKLLRA